MSRKVCLLRRPDEIESLNTLRKLQQLVREHHITEAEARAELDRYPLPDCAHHHHLTQGEARRSERLGLVSFLPNWNKQYAKECVLGGGRRFYPDLIFSGDQSIGRVEMYSVEV